MQQQLPDSAEKYANQNRHRRIWLKIVGVLACAVVFCTTYALILPAITMEKTVCGLEEHIHTDECYTEVSSGGESEWLCRFDGPVIHTHDTYCYDENGQLICILPERQGHVHTEECYAPSGTDAAEGQTDPDGEISDPAERVCGEEELPVHQHGPECRKEPEVQKELVCTIPEHTHSEDCYNKTEAGDPAADVETREDWEKTLERIRLTGEYRQDTLAVARSQLGYAESVRNFIVAEDGTVKGYSRYGAWYGDAYGDWCAMYVSFCLHYAGVEAFPEESNCSEWIRKLSAEDVDLYREAAGAYEPSPGDLIFFDYNGDRIADHVGLVEERILPEEKTEPAAAELKVLEGNSGNQVREVVYEQTDSCILGYGQLPEQTFTCKTAGHAHTADCLDEAGDVVCGLEEHIHTEECEAPPAEEETQSEETALPVEETQAGEDEPGEETQFEQIYEGADYTVRVTYGKEAGLPEDAVLQVREIAAGTEEYQTYYEQSAQTLDENGLSQTIVFARFFDISFYVGDQIAEPTGPVAVTIRYSDMAEPEQPADCQAIHFAEDGPELLPVETKEEEGSTSFTHTQNRFSVVGDLMAVDAESVEQGPDKISVDYFICLDGMWTQVGSTETGWDAPADADGWNNYNRDYITVAQAASVLGKYGFSPETPENAARVVAYQQKPGSNDQNIYSDTDQVEIDGRQVIPLARNRHAGVGYNLYYLPGNTASFSGYPSTDRLDRAANAFYSVSVKDTLGLVYTDEERPETQIVRDGDSASVKVLNADGVLWSCVGTHGKELKAESVQSDGNTIFTIQEIGQPVEVTATKTDPAFTVQYYGNIPRFASSGSTSLTVIDTSGKALPTNGGTMATRKLYLEGTGQNTGQNRGAATELYRIKTVTELTKLYSSKEYRYLTSPDLTYFNKLQDNENYTLTEIWVLKPGKNADSTDRRDWTIYSYHPGSTAFTNEAGQAGGDTILIEEGSVIRLVSDTSSGAYHNDTTFYDYNISSGQNADGRWRTGITGINSESNYGTSLNGQRTWRSGADVLAFGNANCGTGMSGYLFDGSTLNKYSSKNSGYEGATFGLAAGINADGTIRYNEWITAPKLFNDGDAIGKQTYTGSSLTFDRVGDTYTLSAATLKNSNGQSNTLSGLQYFFNPSPVSTTIHTHIFTNNFWPMDPAAGRTDALWGLYGNPGSFQGYAETNSYNWSDLAKNFPIGDDGNAHNWFFGMNFALSFSLTEDYEGPLEYYFFGDDDLWVFLDGKLVCDIGGVHRSIGEYVNLRDYLPVGSSGTHTLSFFYTERGASGSTCYMSFTLPSVSSATTAQEIGSLQVAKTVASEEDYSNVSYRFCVDLLTEEEGTALNRTFSYQKQDGTYGTIRSGGTLTLKAGDVITIQGIPAGTYYKVTELSTNGYQTTVNGAEGYITAGTIETGQISAAAFVNTPHQELPATGGPGTWMFTLGGLALMAGTLLCIIFRRRQAK